MLASVNRQLVGARNQFGSAVQDHRPQTVKSLPGDRRNGNRRTIDADRRKVTFGLHHHCALCGQGRIAKPQQDIRISTLALGACHADRFDFIDGVTQPGGVDQHERYPADRHRHFDDIARGPRDRCDDGPFGLCQRIDKARLSRIRWTGNDDPDAVAQRLDPRRGDQRRHVGFERGNVDCQIRIARTIGFVGIVDRDLGAGRQVE